VKAGRTVIAWGAAVLVLLAVFLAYLRPDFALTLATRLWNCF
jgi:hypothetical protein